MKLKTGLQSEMIVPMASMADIALLLIIFFMLTSTFATDTGLDVTLPKAETSQVLPRKEISVVVKRSGAIFVNKEPVEPGRLREVLKQELAKTSLQGVTIRGDEGVPYGTIVMVMDDAQQLGAAIVLAAELVVTEGQPLPPGVDRVERVGS
ncbi:MAG: ExbD/TolR family protein [Armatimonadota bacterium]